MSRSVQSALRTLPTKLATKLLKGLFLANILYCCYFTNFKPPLNGYYGNQKFWEKINFFLFFISEMLPFHKFNAPLKNHPKQSTSSGGLLQYDVMQLN